MLARVASFSAAAIASGAAMLSAGVVVLLVLARDRQGGSPTAECARQCRPTSSFGLGVEAAE